MEGSWGAVGDLLDAVRIWSLIVMNNTPSVPEFYLRTLWEVLTCAADEVALVLPTRPKSSPSESAGMEQPCLFCGKVH